MWINSGTMEYKQKRLLKKYESKTLVLIPSERQASQERCLLLKIEILLFTCLVNQILLSVRHHSVLLEKNSEQTS